MRFKLRALQIALTILCLLATQFLPLFAYAQSGGTVTITPPDLSSFPTGIIHLYAYDDNNHFVHDLGISNIRILENGESLEVKAVEKQRPGVQIVFAINPGPSFAIQNSQAVSRYDFILDAIKNWVASRQIKPG